MSGPPHPRPTGPAAGGGGVAGSAQPGGCAGGLALHHQGRPHQAEVSLPNQYNTDAPLGVMDIQTLSDAAGRKEMALTSPSKTVTITATAVAVMVTIAFTLGLILAPDHTSHGYRIGNEDGYSIGYNDGKAGTPPNPHRFMTQEDYQIRGELGERDRTVKAAVQISTDPRGCRQNSLLQIITARSICTGMDIRWLLVRIGTYPATREGWPFQTHPERVGNTSPHQD